MLETIRLYRRRFHNLSYHGDRLNGSRRALLGAEDPIDLQRLLTVPGWVDDRLYKCRVVYGERIQSIEFLEYSPRRIGSLRLVYCDDIDYSHKLADRGALDRLLERRNGCDEILIVKDGMVTDTSYSNIALTDGDAWITPRTPLLAGTKRRELIEAGAIEERDVPVTELRRYRALSLINAMNDLIDATIDMDKVLG